MKIGEYPNQILASGTFNEQGRVFEFVVRDNDGYYCRTQVMDFRTGAMVTDPGTVNRSTRVGELTKLVHEMAARLLENAKQEA